MSQMFDVRLVAADWREQREIILMRILAVGRRNAHQIARDAIAARRGGWRVVTIKSTPAQETASHDAAR